MKMDDEECLPENSNLKTHLQSLGYDDFQVKKSPTTSAAIKNDHASFACKGSDEEFIDEEIIEQIGILVSTRMLFEEDVRNIENLLCNFKAKKCGMLKNIFQGMFGFVILFGLLLYWLIGSYAFFVGSTFYAYKAADYLWRKNYSQARLKKLASVLQSNYALISKTVKFINENNKYVECNGAGDCGKSIKVAPEYDLYNNFKSDFYVSLIDLIDILSNSTKKLILQMPLYDYVENPKYYICNNFNINCYDTLDLFKLYQIYLLVQSEFLQRFILSLIPNLNLLKGNNFHELNKVVTESCVKLLKVKNNLHKKFKFVFFNGIHNSSTKTSLISNSSKLKMYSSSYKEELASNIHDVSNTFQNLLIKSRTMEENLKTNKVPKDLENDLINIQSELNVCQRNISDGFILLKKAVGEKQTPKVEVSQPESQHMVEEVEKVQVGYTDLNPSVEDEIFEAYFAEGNTSGDSSKYDDWDLDEIMKKKLQKEYSKTVMTELKSKLVDKAKNWEKREAEIMLKKNKSIRSDLNESDMVTKENDLCKICDNTNNKSLPDVTNLNDLSPEKNEWNPTFVSQNLGKENESQIINSNSEKQSKDSDGILVRENNSIQRKAVKNDYPDEDFQKGCLGFVNKNFLTDISNARQRILQTKDAFDEQCYCDSGDNSDDTD